MNMQRILRSVTLLVLLPASGMLAAQEADDNQAERLLETRRCYMCHDMREPSLGPPWQAIAARHKARKDLMLEVLAHKIVHGGGGNWGQVPMVPNQWVSNEEAKAMARWILNLQDNNEN